MQLFNTILLAATAAVAVALPQGDIETRAADVKAFDISAAQGSSFMSCMKGQGYGKVIIRGYQQACGQGGRVDPNFLPSYKAAKSAGLHVDSYLFPCMGAQPTGVACKSVQKQLDDYIKFIGDNKMDIDRLWFDLEPTSGECSAWQESKATNLKVAKQWIAALKATKLKWGVYANGNQWTAMFASRSTNVASDLPLWAVQFDKKPGVSTVDTFMGGWTKAYSKQYYLDTKDAKCGGSLDLNSFTA